MVTPFLKPSAGLYPAVWRWHFYAGLFVLPFILILSVTGAIYLFKPQIDRWEERAFTALPATNAVSPDEQRAAALRAVPNAAFNRYRLPERPGDAAMIQLSLPDGTLRNVYVAPRGQVLGMRDAEAGISETVARIHGSLLLGSWGDRLVELAASWTIVMIVTGLYLWWPRPWALAGTLWPRLRLRGRPLLKDLHRVTGFWIAGLVLVMLASGLPWAGTWGSAFKWARGELGLVDGPQAWKIESDAGHSAHSHAVMSSHPSMRSRSATLPLSAFVARARAERMAFPVFVIPPNTPQRFGPPTGNVWTIKSEAQNRTLNRKVTYDPVTGVETGRRDFADSHVIDRIVNTGVAWHEGQLFGWINQLIGLATAITLIALSIVGVLMWLKRRPGGTLGAPPAAPVPIRGPLIAAIAVLALLLPLFAISALAVVVLDLARARLARST